MTENNDAANQQGNGDEQDKGKTFTQAELDQIITDRLAQQAKNKFGDYDALKAQAAGAKTLEDRVGTLESELESTRTDAARVRIAAKFGISTDKGANGEPSDADVMLTGSDEAAMTLQAERYAGRVEDLKKNGNRAPKEGGTTTGADKDKDLRDFTRELFAAAQTD